MPKTIADIAALYPNVPTDLLTEFVGAFGDDAAALEQALPLLENLADIDVRRPLSMRKGAPCDVVLAPVEGVDEVILDVGDGRTRIFSAVLTRMEALHLGVALLRVVRE